MADVVEVVRCRECKYRKKIVAYGITNYYCKRNEPVEISCLLDDFCSRGEKKDDEQD